MTSTTKRVLTTATLALAASLALARSNTHGEVANSPSAPASPVSMKAKTDGEILAIVMAIDENEVHAASTAEEKKVAEPVMGFAQTLHQHHNQNLQETKALSAKIGIIPRESPTVAKLREQGKQELTKLMPLTGEAFEKEFLSAMRAGHREALQMLDEFLKTAKNEELKVHLTTTRQSVAMHLQTAENLRS